MKIDRLYELFDQAIALKTPEELAAFLDREAPMGSAERAEVTELLQAHQKGNDLLDRPTLAINLANRNEAEREGQVIGNYKLLQKIGEGGMGVVFMAEQIKPIRRKVAVKIIREGLQSKQILARFDAEREALLRLDHPNVTRIYDAGATEDGRPYFVMELVRGTHITQYCNANKLSIPERLKLIEQICLVIHHAHQKGILHRDIKPSNVMITSHDGIPIPKVIDFGIAKAFDCPLTEQTLFTRYGDLVGTPEYMSPEQAEMSGLDLDVRTDIYSLGVLLYQILTGSTPITEEQIKGKGLLKIFETIRDSEAELPSQRVTRTLSVNETVAELRQSSPKMLRRSLSGDLDWITMKALAKDRTERYESASALARDIRNYLDGEPVDAAAPSFVYRMTKFYRKHQTISLVAIVSTVLLLLSTTFSIYWAIISDHNERVALDQSEELTKKSRELETALERAQFAEKKAEQLAREERRRGTLERAQSRAAWSNMREVLKKQTGVDVEIPLPGGLTMESKFLQMERIHLVDQTGAEAVITSETPLVTKQSVRISASPTNPFDGQLQKLRFLNELIEEQRKEFGNQDVFVGQTLMQRALVRIRSLEATHLDEPPQASPMSANDKAQSYIASENDLREALMILSNSPDHNVDHFECLSLLCEVLVLQEKQTQVEEFRQRALALLGHIGNKPHEPSIQERIENAKRRIGQ